MRTRSILLAFSLAILLAAWKPAYAQIAPVISAIAPSSGLAGTSITLTGRGFTSDNTILFGPITIEHVGITSAIAITCTNDPNCQSGIFQTLTLAAPAVAPGSYSVSVQNTNGNSNEMTFNVIEALKPN